MAKPATAPAQPKQLDPRNYCAVTKSRGGRHYPDFYNSPATKMIQRGDAEAAGFTMYMDGSSCRCGHAGARFVANGQCTDCHRIKKGLPPIYATSKNRTFYKPRAEKVTAAGAPIVVAAAAPLEIDGRDKRILEAYAETRSLPAAAERLGITVGSINARIAANGTFASAVKNLEDRTGIKRTLPAPTDFAWTPEIEQQLIRTWIDTGDIATARDSRGVTPSQYWQHIEDSREFSAMVDKAAPLAAMALREKVQQMALAGNPTLLKEFIPDAPKEHVKMPSDAEMIEEIVRTISLAKNQWSNSPLGNVPELVAARIRDLGGASDKPPTPEAEPEPATAVADSDDDDLYDLL